MGERFFPGQLLVPAPCTTSPPGRAAFGEVLVAMFMQVVAALWMKVF
jgi:hypothetical protein